jgi:tetrahydromethanopterin S-methyltransferase subunit B
MMQEMSDKQDAMQANLNGLIESSNYSLLHLDPLESKIPCLESNLSDLQKGLAGSYEVLESYQGRLDEIDKSINYLLEDTLEKKK